MAAAGKLAGDREKKQREKTDKCTTKGREEDYFL